MTCPSIIRLLYTRHYTFKTCISLGFKMQGGLHHYEVSMYTGGQGMENPKVLNRPPPQKKPASVHPNYSYRLLFSSHAHTNRQRGEVTKKLLDGKTHTCRRMISITGK